MILFDRSVPDLDYTTGKYAWRWSNSTALPFNARDVQVPRLCNDDLTIDWTHGPG